MQHDPGRRIDTRRIPGEPILGISVRRTDTQGIQVLGERLRELVLRDMPHTSAADGERIGLVGLPGTGGNNLAEVAHDARNMVTALALYCDLLQEPGVLSESFQHYAGELRLVTAASRRLVDKLATLDERMLALALERSQEQLTRALLAATGTGRQKHRPVPAEPINNLAAQVRGLRTLLSALAGPAVKLEMIAEGGESAVHLAGEDLTRILVNLVTNSAEAMHAGGHIWVRTGTAAHIAGVPTAVRLAVEDDGPGVPDELLDCIFEAGVTTHPADCDATGRDARGLGLSITRSLVEGAGGTINAARRAPSGTCIEIHLPVRGR